jgi:hypothetical protein
MDAWNAWREFVGPPDVLRGKQGVGGNEWGTMSDVDCRGVKKKEVGRN